MISSSIRFRHAGANAACRLEPIRVTSDKRIGSMKDWGNRFMGWPTIAALDRSHRTIGSFMLMVRVFVLICFAVLPASAAPGRHAILIVNSQYVLLPGLPEIPA